MPRMSVLSWIIAFGAFLAAPTIGLSLLYTANPYAYGLFYDWFKQNAPWIVGSGFLALIGIVAVWRAYANKRKERRNG